MMPPRINMMQASLWGTYPGPMRTGVPSARWLPKYKAVSPKMMNITPDRKSLIRNRFNDASQYAQSSMSYWVRTPGPAQELDKHNSAALPKRQFRSATTGERRSQRGKARTVGVTPSPARELTNAPQRARQRAQVTTAPLRKTTRHRPAHRRSGPACRDRRSGRTAWPERRSPG